MSNIKTHIELVKLIENTTESFSVVAKSMIEAKGQCAATVSNHADHLYGYFLSLGESFVNINPTTDARQEASREVLELLAKVQDSTSEPLGLTDNTKTFSEWEGEALDKLDLSLKALPEWDAIKSEMEDLYNQGMDESAPKSLSDYYEMLNQGLFKVYFKEHPTHRQEIVRKFKEGCHHAYAINVASKNVVRVASIHKAIPYI